ncbi:MAG TPA: aldose epimerase family protein [Gemmataceae bacterium]|nr:aldose epimerase family protein [Gemmataceae bacterium]
MRYFLSISLCLLGASIMLADQPGKFHVSTDAYGQTSDGKKVNIHTLKNPNGMIVKVIDYGTIITEIHVPDREGKFDDIALGFDNLKSYQTENNPYFGCTVGRVCNRIAGAKFTLDGKEYTLAANNGKNTLHGGIKGFDKVVWKVRSTGAGPDSASIKYAYHSKDGEEGFPGNLVVTVTITLTAKNELRLDYEATSDKATPINLTNHSYFNLLGQKDADILGHECMIPAEQYTPTDADLIPTGELKSVKGTAFDFTKPMTFGSRIKEIKTDPVGYDLNYPLENSKKQLVLAAKVTEPKTGRMMTVHTTEPAVQLYTGNFLDGKLKGKNGLAYKQYYGFCLETQHYPDAVHHPNFPSTILEPGKKFESTTVYEFGAK